MASKKIITVPEALKILDSVEAKVNASEVNRNFWKHKALKLERRVRALKGVITKLKRQNAVVPGK